MATDTHKTRTPHTEAEREAAEQLGVTVPTLRIFAAAIGTGPYPNFALRTQRDVAAHFGVSRRTVAEWIKEGAPGRTGDYRVAEIEAWRKLRYNNPAPNPKLPSRQATGEALRAVYRVLRVDIVQAANDALADFLEALDPAPDVKESLEAAFLMAIDRHFDQFRLPDADIDRVVQEVWKLV